MSLSDIFIAKIKRAQQLLGRSRDPLKRFQKSPDAIPFEERNRGELHKLFYENDGPMLQKWHHYLAIYDRHLARFKHKPVRLLEIGVLRGGSLRLWRRYLGSEAIIFGIDIAPGCAEVAGGVAEIRIGSQADPAFLERVVSEMGGLEVVIDDGSHVSQHQRISFETLFPLLSQNGVYICEDLHTSYWRGFHQGGFRRPTTFIERTKRLVDDLHTDFHGRKPGLANAHRAIDSVSFYNSVVVIEKKLQMEPAHIEVGIGARAYD